MNYLNLLSILLILMISGFMSNLLAQNLLTLEDAISIALENNHDVLIERFNVEVAENSATIGNAGLLPSVGVNGETTYSNADSEVEIASFGQNGRTTQKISGDGAESKTYQAGVNANLVVFDGFRGLNRYKVLKLGEELSDVQLKTTLERTVASTSQSYLTIENLAEQLNTAEDAIALSADRLNRLKEAEKFGSATSLQVLQAQVDLSTDSSAYNQVRLRLEVAKSELNRIMGRDADEAFETSDTEISYYNLGSKMVLMDMMKLMNSTLEAQDLLLTQSELQTELTKANRYPKVSLNWGYGYYKEENDLGQIVELENTGFNAGVSVRFNLFNGGQIKTGIQNQKLRVKQQEQRIRSAEQSLRQQFEAAYLTYQNNLKDFEYEKSNLELFEQNYERSKVDYENGAISGTDLRTAQLNFIRAKNRITNLESQVRSSVVTLKLLTGQVLEMAE